MILPIIAYGHPVLKKEAIELPSDYANLESLLENMWETMYNANGVGLAAPQVGLSVRLFLIDTVQIFEENPEKGIKKAFINPEIISEDGKPWAYEEGCLSIPHIRADVSRLANIKISYYDENFKQHTEEYDDINARVIQHEYDHIEGKLFTEKLKPLKKRMLKRKLEAIKEGNVKTDYRMKFYRR
jgi:peptide deformylase